MATIPDSIPSSSTLPPPAGFRWSWLFYAFLGLILAAVLAFNIFRPITVLPRIGLAPGYALTDSQNQILTSEDNRGQMTLYSFTYTHCQADCPQAGDVLAGLHQALTAAAPPDFPVSFVTVSLDPERDTPAARQAYLAQFQQAQGDVSWHFLAGDPTRTRYMVGGGFELYYRQEEADRDGHYRITFEPRFALVDGMGIIRAEYLTANPDPDIIIRDLNLLAEEARRSHGAARLAYEAAHLFMCYPPR